MGTQRSLWPLPAICFSSLYPNTLGQAYPHPSSCMLLLRCPPACMHLTGMSPPELVPTLQDPSMSYQYVCLTLNP